MLSTLLAGCSGPNEREGDDESSTTASVVETATPFEPGPNAPSATAGDTAVTTPDPNATAPATPPVAPATPADSSATAQPGATETPPGAQTPTVSAQTTVDLNAFSLELEQVGSGFDQPVLVTHAGDGSGRIFVLEKTGRVRLLDGTVYMDISDRVLATVLISEEHEMGLVGLAFHPDFANNGIFFLHYIDLNQDHIVSRFTQGANGTGDPASEQILLTFDQPEVNFVGGTLAFGTDGYLYIATGTGTGVDADQVVAQQLDNLWGKILRIDVDNGDPYAIPADNPFVNTPGARQEVWAYGLRNPWRFDFDPANNDLYIGGPGEFMYEWINFVPGGNAGGLNFGWPIIEGNQCWELSPLPCETTGIEFPIIERPSYQDGNCVIIGGVVHRGPGAAAAQGAYFYSDYCSGRIWAAGRDTSGAWQTREMLDTAMLTTSFGKDEQGESYVTDGNGGIVYRIVVR